MDVLASPVCGVTPGRALAPQPCRPRRRRSGGPCGSLFAERTEDAEPAVAEATPERRRRGGGDLGRPGRALGRPDPRRGPGADPRLVARLELLREAAPSLALDALIDQAVGAPGYDLALLMRAGGRRRMANVRKLMRLAREYEADEGRDLRGFLDWARLRSRDLAPRGRGHDPGRRPRRGADHDHPRLEGPGVPGGRRGRPWARDGSPAAPARRCASGPTEDDRSDESMQGRPAAGPPRAGATLDLRVPGAGRRGGRARPRGGAAAAPRGHDPRRTPADPERGRRHGGAREGATRRRAADGRGPARARLGARPGAASVPAPPDRPARPSGGRSRTRSR